MSDERRAVVLGGTGFVGRHVCAAFAAAGWDVVAAARNEVDIGVPVTRVDIAGTDPTDLARLLAALAPTVVANCAGMVWAASPQEMWRSNVVLTERVLAALPERVRYVHIGSIAEYAPVAAGTLITEECPVGTQSPYGHSKATASAAALAAANTVVLRATHLLGPGVPADSLIGRVTAQLTEPLPAGRQRTVRLLPLNTVRDYLDVRDLGRAVVAAARADVAGRVVNIGGGRPVAVRGLVADLVTISGVVADVVEVDRAGAAGGDRQGAADWQVADIRLAERLLGWRPAITAADSLAAVWAAAAHALPTAR